MNRQRLKITVRGAVQGVGFRPFVYRLASELQLNGWVLNSAQGVFIEVEGEPGILQEFLNRLEEEKPPRAFFQNLETSFLEPVGYRGFQIRESSEAGGKTALILPDMATCADCLREILEPGDRRFRYPFTNCTNCGPRFSIIEGVPYDRANTSMKKFVMCADCAREYGDPGDRRFHAEPTACPRCGPQLQLWNSLGVTMAMADRALRQAAQEIRHGHIVGLKGLGGFQLLVDARNNDAVQRLRERKHREEKPFALMFSSLEAIRTHCEVSELEQQLLQSPEAPIVLLKQHSVGDRQLAASVAPGNPNLGAMLACTPLHHLLLRELNFPIVATSGNLSDEPICIEEHEALERLRGIADFFLVHNRPIVRHVDDSIVRVLQRRAMILRRARGYAPLPITVESRNEHRESRIVLALGAHLKNTVALRVGDNVFISQHIGDLETKQAHDAFRRSASDLPRLYEAHPQLIVHDLHPEYLSTKYALEQPTKRVAVQHHWAHIVSCMAENQIEPPALGVAWDGTGYGLDGTIWGGEFLLAREGSFQRVAHFRQFALPGGDAAIKEPRRSALGLLHEIFGEALWARAAFLKVFAPGELKPLRIMLAKKFNAPATSSVGRLFDAVAALTGLRQRATFEGQAAMELEFAAAPDLLDAYPFELKGESPIVIDWETAILELLSDQEREETTETIAARFHNMLVDIIAAIAQRIGEPQIILSGGCFQNRRLTESAIDRLCADGFHPCWHTSVPPNDGGISLGQVVAAAWGEAEDVA